MEDLKDLLRGFYVYTEKGFVRTPGLNWFRKIHHIRRSHILTIPDMKVFNIEMENLLEKKQSEILRKRKRTLFIRQRMQEKKNNFIDKLLDKMFAPRIFVENQMENADAHGFGSVEKEQSGNVLLTQAHGQSVAVSGKSIDVDGLSCEDTVGTYAEMSERWLNIKKLSWKNSSVSGTGLLNTVLPRDYVRDHSNTINVAPFKYHAYWKGDMEIKVQINSNKFQIGQLQVAWFYGGDRDESFEWRCNKYLISQMYHGLLDAGSSNEVTLFIPYRFHSPMMNTVKNSRMQDFLSMGNLLIYVLNPLQVPTGQPTVADLAVWVRMVNSSFGGTIDRGIPVESQMETALALAAAEGALRLTGIKNCDNPSDIRPPTYVVPTAIHALSVGSGIVEPLFPLRLDARGQTQNQICSVMNEHNSIYDIARVFGLINTITWGKNHVTETELMHVRALPNLGYNQYPKIEDDSLRYGASYALPPVAIVSNMFAQWRGSLEFRLDFIASQFHTGRLMIVYIPILSEKTAVSMDKARSSYHVIFDLQEAKTCTFNVPFVYHDIWYRNDNKMGDSETHNGSIGSVRIFVVNSLKCPDTVASDVAFNLYVRAGDSFEVAIPIQPSCGLNFVRYIKNTNNEELKADNESSDGLYIGRWNDFPKQLVLRWGTLAGRTANFPGAQNLYDRKITNIYFKDTARGMSYVINKKNSKGKDECVQTYDAYYTILKRADTWTAFVFSSAEKARNAWNAEIAGKDIEYENFTCANDSNSWSSNKPTILTVTKYTVSVENQMEREISGTILNPANKLLSMNGGMKVFGENFLDIKDLCRRYQYFGQYVIRGTDMRNGNGVLFQFPTFPQGILINQGENVDYVQNKCRDGIIPLLLSGFRFYRGGLRFKIIIPAIDGLSFWVQHRPEIIREENVIAPPSSSDSELDMLAHGYGSHLVIGVVNGVLEFEIPFYQSGIYGELGKRTKVDNDSAYFGNGLVVFGYNNLGGMDVVSKLAGTRISIYYSVADDFQFNTFQGFPPVIDAGAIAADFPENFVYVENQGLGDMFSKAIGDTVAKAADESIIGQKLSEIATSLTNIFRETFGASVSKEKYLEFSIFIASQIAHLINNYTAKTMAIVIVSVFSFIGIKFALVSQNIINVLEAILEKFIGLPNKLLAGGSIKVDNQADLEESENLFITYINAMFTAICIYFKVNSRVEFGEGMLVKLKNLFTMDISSAIRTGNGLYIFLKNHFIIVKHMLKKVLSLLFSRYDVADTFNDPDGMGYQFFRECRTLTDLNKVEEYRNEPLFVERVTACENIGRNLLLSILRTPEDVGSKLHQEVEKSLQKITNVSDDLKRIGIYPSIRRRPFHLYLTGKAGTGKTVLMDAIAKSYLEHVIPSVTIHPNYCCTVDTGTRWWSQCNGKQPILIFDDLWSTTQGPVFDEMLVHYLAIHSNIPFTPPMAAVEDKKMLYAPECVISTSNYAFPNLNGVDQDAINRRRNLLVEVDKAPLDPISYPNCQHCMGVPIELVKKSDLVDFHHLRFYVYENVVEPKVIPSNAKWMSYDELLEIMIEKALIHKEKEDEMYKEKIAYFEERKRMVNGDTLEERLINESQMHMNYFERLIDTQIDCSKFAVNIKVRLMNIVERCVDKLYALNLFQVENQNEPEPSTSKPLQERNDNFIANSEAFNPLLESVFVTRLELEKILNLNPAYGMREKFKAFLFKRIDEGNNKAIKKPYVTYYQFYEYLKKKHPCLHTGNIFMKTNYIDGNFITGEYVLPEDAICEEWCILNTEFKYLLMQEWANSSSIKQLYIHKNVHARVPKLLCRDKDSKRQCFIKTIILEVKVLTENLYKQIAQNSLVQATVTFVKKVGVKIWQLIKEWCYVLVPLLGFATYNLTRTESMLRNSMMVESQTHNYDARVLRTAKPMLKEVAVAHQSATQQAHHVELLLHSNSVWITVEYLVDGKICSRKSRCLMLGIRKLLILRHYLDFFEALERNGCKPVFYFSYVDSKFRKIAGAGRIEVKILDLARTEMCYENDRDCNFIIVELPGTIPAAKDITKFFATKSDHSYVGRTAWLVQVSELTERVNLSMEDRNSFVISPGAENAKPVTIYNSYTYDFEGKGICGSILVAPGLEKPIIGMHVAGSPGVMGIAEPLVAESFRPAATEVKDIASLELNDPEYSNVSLTTTLFPKGTVGVPYTQHQSEINQYVPSLIHGVFEVQTQPANLGKIIMEEKVVTPLEIGASKHGLISDPFPCKLVKECKENLQKKLMVNVVPVKEEVGVLKLETAIIGDPHIEEFTPLRWTSSEGFPLVKERPKNVRCKKWLFDLVECTDGSYILNGIHPRLKQILEHELFLRKNGEVPVTIFTDVCKDELLPPGKATRVFSTAPVQFVIAFRMYFGDFMAAYRRSRLKSEHGIGVDVNSFEWTKIAKYLQKFGTNIVAGDYSHFGYTLNAQFVTAAFEIIFEWYATYSKSPTLANDQLVRKCLMNEILNVHRLASNFVYQSACGIPSGFPATDIMNSMVNCLYIRAAWREITRKSFYEFSNNVNLLVYGDDLAMNVSDEYIDIFNTETLHCFFKQYGIKFTDIDKSNNIIPFRNLKTATFLKCHFRPHERRIGVYTAALDKASVEGAANWIHKKDDMKEATIENAKQCLELAHGHGPLYYNFVKEKLQSYFKEKLNTHFDYFEYEEIDSRRYEA